MKRSASEPGLNNQLRQASHCLGQAKGNSFMSKEHARIRAFFNTAFFRDCSRTIFNFQQQPTRNVISKVVQKCKSLVHFNRTFRVKFNCLLHQLLYIIQFTCLKLTVNNCIKQKMHFVNHLQPLWAMINLGQPKRFKKLFQRVCLFADDTVIYLIQ